MFLLQYTLCPGLSVITPVYLLRHHTLVAEELFNLNSSFVLAEQFVHSVSLAILKLSVGLQVRLLTYVSENFCLSFLLNKL